VGVFFHRKCYEWKISTAYRPKAYTISVGNIVAGGAGKTPCTIFLAEKYRRKGKVAIVCRPYKAALEKAQKPILVNPEEHTAAYVGDEALLLARRLSDVAVWVGNKRKAAEMADASGVDFIIIDDGFQHFALMRDLDIVVLDVTSHLKGLCREPLSSIQRADLVVLNKRAKKVDTADFEIELKRYTCARIVEASYTVEGLFDFDDNPVTLDAAIKVAIFCGIANPVQFQETIQALGFDVVESYFAKDHELPDHNFLTSCISRSMPCICTEKDRVKLQGIKGPLYWLKVSCQIPQLD
jgi:tetraacyldisaccharide 4'-kinase